MRTVQVYIEGQRLDLFKDEIISVTSKQQDIQDISKVFTDFSQSFSVPSTPKNDAIFKHFYNSDIGDIQDVSTIFDHNIRRDAYIEIDLTTFRRGKISLEKSEVKNNQAYSYQITFYGDITSLKDKFGEEKLQNLDLVGIYSHEYTGTEIENRITDGATNYVIRYPLIAQRYLTYQDGGVNDISPTGSSQINYTELFPAIRIAALFGAIQGRYGVTFEGTFLTDKRFQNCFLYCQNKNNFEYLTETFDLELDTGGQSAFVLGTAITPPEVYTDYFTLSDNSLTYGYIPFNQAVPSSPSNMSFFSLRHKVNINTYGLDVITATYYIDVILNGVLQITYDSSQFTGNAIITQISNDLNDINLEQQTYSFRVRASEQINIEIEIIYSQEWVYLDSFGSEVDGINTYYAKGTTPLLIEGNISVLNYLPDMKVSEFFTGVLKEFNLTCYGIAEGVFQVEPLDDWYAKGAVINITEYTDIKSIKIDRVKLYKSISFEYEQSQNILNNNFRDLFSREYGDAVSTFNYDGGEYKIKQPFENMLMTKFTNTDLQVGFTIDKDLNTYVPKPMLLYMYDNKTCAFKYYDGTSTSTINTYLPFGQDVTVNNSDFTLNFNAEVSTLTNLVNLNTLFSVYYSPYLLNLYNLKNRRTTVKTNLPVSLLTNLRLNDRVVIRDKRYIIESMKSNLNTGDVDLVLINDFRPVIGIGNGSLPNEPLLPDFQNQCLDVRILFPNGVVQADVTCSNPSVTITPSTLTSEGTIEVCIPENPTSTTILKTEDDLDYINTEDLADRVRTEEGNLAVYTLVVTYTFSNGTQTSNQIFIQQQP